MAELNTIVTFPGLSAAEANLAAAELRDILLEDGAFADGAVEVRKESQRTMDFGTTLAIVFGTPAAIAVARGLQAYITRSGNVVEIETSRGRVRVGGTPAEKVDVARVAEVLTGRK